MMSNSAFALLSIDVHWYLLVSIDEAVDALVRRRAQPRASRAKWEVISPKWPMMAELSNIVFHCLSEYRTTFNTFGWIFQKNSKRKSTAFLCWSPVIRGLIRGLTPRRALQCTTCIALSTTAGSRCRTRQKSLESWLLSREHDGHQCINIRCEAMRPNADPLTTHWRPNARPLRSLSTHSPHCCSILSPPSEATTKNITSASRFQYRWQCGLSVGYTLPLLCRCSACTHHRCQSWPYSDVQRLRLSQSNHFLSRSLLYRNIGQ